MVICTIWVQWPEVFLLLLLFLFLIFVFLFLFWAVLFVRIDISWLLFFLKSLPKRKVKSYLFNRNVHFFLIITSALDSLINVKHEASVTFFFLHLKIFFLAHYLEITSSLFIYYFQFCSERSMSIRMEE